MKGYILEVNLAEQRWSSKPFPMFLTLTWELRYPQKRGVNTKKGGVLEVALEPG